jgi:shikimate kinase
MPYAGNILLIGLRGSGKSTLGPRLADRVGFTFTDLDNLVARAMGEETAGAAFAKHGQAAFRQMEGKMLVDVVRPARQVIALGGGTPTGMVALEAIKREQAADRAKVFYLRAEPQTLRDRLRKTDISSRPSLTGADPLDEIDAVFSRRDPLYCGLADETIIVDDSEEDAVLEELARAAMGE